MNKEHVCYQCGGFGCHHCNHLPHGKIGKLETLCLSVWAGLIHLTKEAAELHSKALRSFTEVK